MGRVSFTGEMGYEMWVTSEYQRALYDLLTEAGQTHGLKVIGGRALNALRLEKSFGTWAREFRPIYGPIEAGLGRFVDFNKGDFIGREAALKERDSGGERTLITLSINTQAHDAIGDEPIFHAGKVVGWVTSGGYGHSVSQSLAMGYVDNACATEIDGFEVELVGKLCKATRLSEAAVDPKGLKMRG
jgi:dimethylglycine dehydrogenase